MAKKPVRKYELEASSAKPVNYDIDEIIEDGDELVEAMQDSKQFDRVSFPPMVLPNLIEDGKGIRGVLLSSRPSARFKKQHILQLRLKKSGQEISLPASRGISIYLFDKDTGELKNDLIGRELIIRRKGTKRSEKNNKDYPIFDVAIGKKAVEKN